MYICMICIYIYMYNNLIYIYMYGVYQSTGIYCDFKQGIILCLDNNPAPLCDCWYLINYEKLLLLWSLYIYIHNGRKHIYIYI